MANVRLPELPTIGTITTGTTFYVFDSSTSYQSSLEKMASSLITNYRLLDDTLDASLMTISNAEVLLEGLNNASVAQLLASRIDLESFFDMDGGGYYDYYLNSDTFDGGVY